MVCCDPSGNLRIRPPSAAMSSSTPSIGTPPGDTRTCLPRPSARASQSSRTVSNPNRACSTRAEKWLARTSNTSMRSMLLSCARSEIQVAACPAPGGTSATLIPIPDATQSPCSSLPVSTRMPQSFAPFTRTSLGHFRRTSASEANSRAVSLTASAVAKGIRVAVAIPPGSRNKAVQKRFPLGETHSRCSLPRPADCSSATIQQSSKSPACARRRASVLVLSIVPKRWTGQAWLKP